MAVPGLEGQGSNLLPSASRAVCYSIRNKNKLWETDLPWHAPWVNRGQIRAIDYQSGFMSEPSLSPKKPPFQNHPIKAGTNP